MREIPILFSGEMVRAILEGRKTQTRRLVKFPEVDGDDQRAEPERAWLDRSYEKPELGGCACLKMPYGPEGGDLSTVQRFFPRWEAGDRLWVREEHYRFGHWEPVPGVRTKGGRQKWKFVADSDEVRYADNPPIFFRKGMHKETPNCQIWHKRLARFMPRRFSRITLKTISVRLERLQEISEEDSLAEGVKPKHDACIASLVAKGAVGPGQLEYYALWESINGSGSWEVNPWVWVLEFEREMSG